MNLKTTNQHEETRIGHEESALHGQVFTRSPAEVRILRNRLKIRAQDEALASPSWFPFRFAGHGMMTGRSHGGEGVV
jgi:hypothetical protein